MLNFIWLGLVLGGVLLGGAYGRLRAVSDAAFESAGTAVTLAIGLIGIMSLWLGVMRLAERAGLVQALARGLRPALQRLFPEVPAAHPAMGSMVMNIAANVLGLTNAGTPLGLRAMRDLEQLNPHPGTATNAMCTFLAINTASVQLVPVTAMAILASAGSRSPSVIVGTTLLATAVTTVAAVIAVKSFERMRWFRAPSPSAASPKPAAAPAASASTDDTGTTSPAPLAWPGKAVMGVLVLGFAAMWLANAFPEWLGRTATVEQLAEPRFARGVNALSLLAVPVLLAAIPLYAALKRLKVYEEFVEGAKEGFQVAVKIIPYLVAMLVAIAVFRAGGGIELITRALEPVLAAVHFPSELLPMALMRPLSGSGSLAILSDLAKQLGPDHLVTRMAATIYGSSETTFYVLAVYFGSVGIQRTRHALPAGLLADAVGVVASVAVCRWVLG